MWTMTKCLRYFLLVYNYLLKPHPLVTFLNYMSLMGRFHQFLKMDLVSDISVLLFFGPY